MPPVLPPRANYEERVRTSAMCNRRMVELFQDASAMAWHRLFNWMDDDLSGKVSYSEFTELMREELKLSPEELSEDQLLAVWTALDEDRSGFITQNEFNNFMRTGAHVVQGGEAWVDMMAIMADKEYEALQEKANKPKLQQRKYQERYFAQPPPETNAQEAATRVYNRGGILVRSDPHVKAVTRNGEGFPKTQFHGSD
mmetsp:Transcript_34310/g.61807  ORF Transcript_34310/g.61807 Transcript_34310/m.61807 type:complete len:198 (+) Transcript_34310:71-664(+)